MMFQASIRISEDCCISAKVQGPCCCDGLRKCSSSPSICNPFIWVKNRALLAVVFFIPVFAPTVWDNLIFQIASLTEVALWKSTAWQKMIVVIRAACRNPVHTHIPWGGIMELWWLYHTDTMRIKDIYKCLWKYWEEGESCKSQHEVFWLLGIYRFTSDLLWIDSG